MDAAAAAVVDLDLATPQAYLGVLGSTGLTAYVALTETAPVREGDVVFVSAAAGAVGSAAGQIARKLGAARVIGSAGGPEKAAQLLERFGFDAAIDYKAGPIADALAAAAPDGIDVYLDNVGGETLAAALAAMRTGGRAAIVGHVSQYNLPADPPGPNLYQLALRELSVRGLLITSRPGSAPSLDRARRRLARRRLPAQRGHGRRRARARARGARRRPARRQRRQDARPAGVGSERSAGKRSRSAHRPHRPITQGVDHRLTEDSVVTISLPAGAPVRLRDFNATVIARVKSGVVLEPIGVVAAALPARSENVFLSFVSGTGLVALKGSLTHDRGALRFQVQDGIRVHARRYTRVEAELSLSLRRADADKGWAGTSVNIAQEGLLARSQFPAALDDDVALTLWLPGIEQPLELQARVVRHADDMAALRFVDVGPYEQAAIAEFVIEQRLAERQALDPR